MLAWGRGSDVLAVGLADRLAVRQGGEWRFVAWDAIDVGGWDPATGELRWSGEDIEGSVALDEPGALPELFRERVQASIALQQVLDLGGGERAVISARRNPGRAEGDLSWRVSHPSKRLTDASRAYIEAEVSRLRAEYDIG